MHELSIVASLIELAEDNLKAQKAKEITKIVVKIGRLSGVETELFERCFETFKQDSLAKNATLEIELGEVIGECECGFKGLIKENVFYCPKCKGKDLKITEGEELYLMRLEME